MSLLNKLFGKDSKMNLSQPLFFAKQFLQSDYDREIDEGMSSGMRRYATLDVTKLSKKQVKQTILRLVEDAEDFNLCKLIQVAGFNKKDKRYLTVSGESHALFKESARDLMLDRIKHVAGKLPVKYLDTHVTPPTQEEQYKPTNLGKYGSTGSPSLDIPQHPDAQKLRDQGKIR